VGFSRRNKIPRCSADTISEKAIRFRHPDYNQKLITSSMSRYLSTSNISTKCMHAFLSNLANRPTDRQTRANVFTSSFVGGNEEISTDTTERLKAFSVIIHFGLPSLLCLYVGLPAMPSCCSLRCSLILPIDNTFPQNISDRSPNTEYGSGWC